MYVQVVIKTLQTVWFVFFACSFVRKTIVVAALWANEKGLTINKLTLLHVFKFIFNVGNWKQMKAKNACMIAVIF